MRNHFTSKVFRGTSRDWDSYVRDGRPPRDPADLPGNVGIADAHRRGWNRKRSNHNHSYSFSRRWLRAQADRPWDDVWSEICAQTAGGVGREIRELFLHAVELETYRAADGTVMARNPHGNHEAYDLFVDPEGVLRHVPGSRWPRHRREEDKVELVKLGDGRELHRIRGVWYEIGFGVLPPVVVTRIQGEDGDTRWSVRDPGAHDVLENRIVRRRTGWRDAAMPGRHDQERTRYACSKRSLGKEELRRHRLENDPEAVAAPPPPPVRPRR